MPSSTLVLVRWLVAAAYQNADGQLVQRDVGDEDLLPMRQAKGWSACRMCIVLECAPDSRRTGE